MFSRLNPSAKTLASTSLALFMLMTPAYAATVSEEGAAQLKTLIQSQLMMRKAIGPVTGVYYLTEGEVDVKVADGYYAVSLPHIKIKQDLTTSIEGLALLGIQDLPVLIDMGKPVANMIPGDSPADWKVSFAVPKPVRFYYMENELLGELTLGTQRAVGVWNMDHGDFYRLDANYGDISGNISGEMKVQAEKAALKRVYDRDTSGFMSGQGERVISGLIGSSITDLGHNLSIKEIRCGASFKGYDTKNVQNIRNKIISAGQAVQQTGSTAAASDEQKRKLSDMMTQLISNSFDSYTGTCSISGMDAKNTGGTPDQAESLKFDSASLGFNFSDFRNPAVTVGFQGKFDGLSIQTKDDPFASMIPSDLNFDISMNKVPLKSIMEIGRNVLTGSPEAAQTAAMQAQATVPKLLTEAGTNLTHNFDVTAPSYASKSNGIISANMNAIMGFTADQSLELEGLDKIIALITAEIQKPENAAEAQYLQSVLGPLSIMQMVGQKDPANPDKRSYKFLLNDKGQMTLNGADMSSFMGGSPAPVQAPAPQAPAGETPSPAQ